MSSDNPIVVGVRYLIGIDPGVNTGVAVWNRAAGMLVTVDAGTITEVMEAVKLWSEGLDVKVFFEAVAPQRNRTKLSAGAFARLTGWKGRTNEHGRDAAMLVFGR